MSESSRSGCKTKASSVQYIISIVINNKCVRAQLWNFWLLLSHVPSHMGLRPNIKPEFPLILIKWLWLVWFLSKHLNSASQAVRAIVYLHITKIGVIKKIWGKTLTKKWRGLLMKGTHKHMELKHFDHHDFFLYQKRVNVCEHRVKTASRGAVFVHTHLLSFDKKKNLWSSKHFSWAPLCVCAFHLEIS